jgi:hypothetical protein
VSDPVLTTEPDKLTRLRELLAKRDANDLAVIEERYGDIETTEDEAFSTLYNDPRAWNTMRG